MNIDLPNSDDSAEVDLPLAHLFNTNRNIFKENDFIVVEFQERRRYTSILIYALTIE